MGKELLEYDPHTKTRVWHDYDHSTRKTRIITEQDCEPILNLTKKLSNTPEYKSEGIKNNMMHFARVPNNVIVEWKQKYGIDNIFDSRFNKKIEKLLSSDYKHLRTVDCI